MASVSKAKNGTKRVLFVNATGERKAVRLGNVPVKTAETIKLKVEGLLAASITGTSPDAELSAWVRDVSDTLHERLARAGLVAPKASMVVVTLGCLLERFEKTASVKA